MSTQDFIAVGDALAAYVAGALTTPASAADRELGRLHILDTLASIVACRDLEPAVLAEYEASAEDKF